MADYPPPPLGEDIADLPDLTKRVRDRFVEAVRESDAHDLLTDPPFVPRNAEMFALVCEVVFYSLEIVAIIMYFISPLAAVCVAAVGVLVMIAARISRARHVAPAVKKLEECLVRPAVVVQCYTGGYQPPAEDPTPLFTGIVVFSFDDTVTVERLVELAHECFAAKSGPDDGPLAELKRMLLTGDNEFVKETFQLPREMAGNDVTFASPCMWDRDNDLPDGYLSTPAQLVLVHPEDTTEAGAVPLALFDSRRALELLGA